ncbi:MAG: GDSL-type esterase/lipase family protein [Candidatus Omnitrophica bacterium]|nr:GDSL-type esterase/lipase family protein [Candidatus Omnitrophota bacterium]
MKRIFVHIFISVAALAVSLLFAEAALMFAAGVYRSWRAHDPPLINRDDSTIAIVCLGDSFTFGMGAQKGHSYPQQLERILNQKEGGKRKFVVYNAGVPGNTSSKLLKNLDNSLRRYQPDICLLLIGANDSRQIQDLNCAFHENSLFMRGLNSAPGRVLSRSRVFRIVALGGESIAVRLWQRRLARKHAMFMKRALRCAVNEKKGYDAQKIEESQMHVRRAENYYNAHVRDSQEAVAECRKAIDAWPNNTSAYLIMAQIHMGQDKATPESIDSAIRLLEDAAMICPKADLLDYLWDAYAMRGEFIRAREALEMYLCLRPEAIPRFMNILRCGFPPSDDHKTIKKAVSANLGQTVAALRQRKIKVILQNYPHEDTWASFLGEVAAAGDVAFVDHRSVFKRLASTQGYRQEKYFAKDGHCNNEGYAVMAEDAYQALRKEGWL